VGLPAHAAISSEVLILEILLHVKAGILRGIITYVVILFRFLLIDFRDAIFVVSANFPDADFLV
jgi:hypothetical protein